LARSSEAVGCSKPPPDSSSRRAKCPLDIPIRLSVKKRIVNLSGFNIGALVSTLLVGILSPNSSASARQLDQPNLIQTFPVGFGPFGLAFDGANIWVSSEYSTSVTKLRASDGANLGQFPVGEHTTSALFDGTYVWFTSNDSSKVLRLRASDGTLQGSFRVGQWPVRMAFDGANVWVTNTFDDNVMKLRASDGERQGIYKVGQDPVGIAFKARTCGLSATWITR
jgi:sugar lactone lactonase YvrE